MPTYHALLPTHIYSFLDSMAILYSQLEREMHVALLSGKKISAIEKSLQSKYQVDSTTVRNVYHNLKGKHSGINELKKTQIKDLKSTISSIKQSIRASEKRYKTYLKKGQSTQKQRFIIHQKKRRLAIKEHKLEKLKSPNISLCFGTKKLFKAQYNKDTNNYNNHQEWLADWRVARASSFVMVGSKTYRSGNQLCRLDNKGNLTITVPSCLSEKFGGKISCDGIKFRYGQEFVDIALTPTQHKRGKEYRNGTEMPVTHRFVRKEAKWYLHTHVELPDIPTISILVQINLK